MHKRGRHANTIIKGGGSIKFFKKNGKRFLTKESAGEFILQPDKRNAETNAAQPSDENVEAERGWNMENKL